MLNVHHLELFYFVAKYEGITSAVRKMPYGIQQPAVSGQLLRLEENLGVKLFHRRPFALTPAGEKLYDFVYPFFSKLDTVANQLTGGEQNHLRLVASSLVLTNHLPIILDHLRAEFPDLRLTLRDSLPSGVEGLLADEADLAISVIPSKTAAGIKVEPLMKLPLMLLVPPGKQTQNLQQLLGKVDELTNCIPEPLVSLPEHEALTRLFEEGLNQKGVHWPTTIEVNTLDLVQCYAQQGYGYGVLVKVPGLQLPHGVSAIELTDFPPLEIGLLHRGQLKPLAKRFVQLARAYVSKLKKQSSSSGG
ncbi:MAG: DNA-binding transcriptional LysR family regulator [Verrucomicrobiales bacterium]|jgi:DNA-binding transcriptional LysR family regulator